MIASGGNVRKQLFALRGTRRGGMEAKRLGDLEALELVGSEGARRNEVGQTNQSKTLWEN